MSILIGNLKPRDKGICTGRATANAAGDSKSDIASIIGLSKTTNSVSMISALGVMSAVSTATGVMGVIDGAKMLTTAEKAKDVAGSSLAKIQIGAGITGAVKGTIAFSASVITAENIKSSVPILSKIGNALATVAGVLGVVLGITNIVLQIKSSKNALHILKQLEVEDNHFTLLRLFTECPKDLQRAVPLVFAKLESGIKVNFQHVIEAKKECKNMVRSSILVIAVAVTAIAAAVLGMIFTAGALATVALVLGLIANVASTYFDGASMLALLKKATHLEKGDIIIKIMTIAAAVVTIATAIIFAPSLGIMVAGIVIGSMMLSLPVVGMIYLKLKEKRLEAASKEISELYESLESKRLEKVELTEKIEKKELEELSQKILQIHQEEDAEIQRLFTSLMTSSREEILEKSSTMKEKIPRTLRAYLGASYTVHHLLDDLVEGEDSSLFSA